MAANGEHFSFIWSIKNFSFSFFTKLIYSPSFFVEAMGGTKWRLMLSTEENNVCCRIQRLKDTGPDEFQLDYEISFLSGDKSILRSEMFIKKEYKKSEYTKRRTDSQATCMLEKDEILFRNKDLFIPEDTLTIRCRMWDSKKNIPQSGKRLAETLVETECRHFVGTIEKFSSVEPNSKILVCIKSSESKTFLSSMHLCTTADGKLEVEIKPVEYGHLYKYICNIFIRDAFGNKVKCGHGEFYDTESRRITLTLPKEHLMENKGYYLPNDVLTVECEVILPTGVTKEKFFESECEFENQDNQDLKSFPINPNFSSNENYSESLTTANNDQIALLCKEILWETKVNIPLDFPYGHFIENEGNYLPNGVLATENEYISSTSESIERLDESECGIVRKETQRLLSNLKKRILLPEEENIETYTTLKNDWAKLFNEGILCDVEVQTATETFKAHKAVLIARSSVFKAMLINDMIEKTNNYVKVHDVDADTMRRMLLFMYADTMDDLEFENAKSLYRAADMFIIVSLMRRCASFLKQKFLQSHFCDILLLADIHQDQDLKNDVLNYIEENDVAIFLSAEWKSLEESHPYLTTKVFHDLYMKKRRN